MTAKHCSKCGALFYRDCLEKHEETWEGPPEEVEEEMQAEDAGAQESSASLSSSVPSTAAPETAAAFRMTDETEKGRPAEMVRFGG